MAVTYAYTLGLGILPNDYLRIAASDASSKSKAGADYVLDGTNDQDDLNTALAERRPVLLTEGNFALSAPVLIQEEPALLMGVGPGQATAGSQPAIGSKLLVQSGFSGSQAVLVQRAANDRPLYGVQLRDFVVDGNSKVAANVEGILYRSNRGLIQHVHVHQFASNGVRLLGYTGASPWDLYDTQMTLLQVGDCGGAGVLWDAGAPDGHLFGCVLYNNNDNVIVRAGSEQITSCHFYDAVRYNLWLDGGGSRTKTIGCKIEGAGQHGVNIDTTNGGYSDLLFVGNDFNSNGDSVTNTYDNVIQQGPSGNGASRTKFVGNNFGSKSTVANKPRYGLNLASSATQNTEVVGNTFGSLTQFGTAPLNNAGSGSAPSIIRDNIGYATEASGTASVGAAAVTATVTHGLSVTPAAKDIILTWAADPGSSTKLWASGFGATTFTVNVSPSPGGSGTTVAWQAQVL